MLEGAEELDTKFFGDEYYGEAEEEKPEFDDEGWCASEEKSFGQYLGEYTRLDYEIIIDDLHCRFCFGPVLPNDFADHCKVEISEEKMRDRENYKIKAQNDKRKKEILGPFYAEDEKQGEQAMGKTNIGKKRKNRLKKMECLMEGNGKRLGEGEDGTQQWLCLSWMAVDAADVEATD
ncbi:hypothetical protein AAFF_G00262360 [Aldrovandia affinis]|uniref:Uncharacterized protein n=1 Tax=Aldrovandia affinis TaxID=143900 RepID=A0AAD7SSR7_9TELE|nr:hypothetical protein AAFF_G00262360 [Aldrovandia affinis]